MATGFTTTNSLPPAVQQHLNLALLPWKQPQLIHGICARKDLLPRKSGGTMRYRRYTKLQPFIAPMATDGTVPPPQSLSATDIDATPSYYGTWVGIVEQVTLTVQDPVLNETAKLLGEAMRETEDILIRDQLASSSVAILASNGQDGDDPTEITDADVNRAIRILVGNDARMFVGGIIGEDKIGTGPVRESFIAMGHSNLIPDLENAPVFKSKWNYPNDNNTMSAEWGSINNVRFLLSSLGSIEQNASMLGADVYNIFIAAENSYACVHLDGYANRFIYRPPLLSNPLATTASAAVKFAQVPVILNTEWLLTLKVTLSQPL